jgi:hypothetical protein
LAEICLAYFVTEINRIAPDGMMMITVSKIQNMILLEEYDDRGVKLITHMHLVPRLRMSGETLLLPLYFLKARRGTVLPLNCNTECSDSSLGSLSQMFFAPDVVYSSGDFLEKKCVDIRRSLTLRLLQGLNVVGSPVYVLDCAN